MERNFMTYFVPVIVDLERKIFVHRDVKVCRDWSLRVSDYLPACNKFLLLFCDSYCWSSCLKICHTLLHSDVKENIPFKQIVSHGPQLLNMLLWNYNPEQLIAQRLRANSFDMRRWQNIINFNLFLSFFISRRWQILFEECGQFILLLCLKNEWANEWMGRLLRCSQNPLIIDSEIPLIFSVSSFYSSNLLLHSTKFIFFVSLCLIND